MIEQITQYLPQVLATLTGVAIPLIPTMVMKAVSDRKAITTFEGIKQTASTELQQIKTIAENLKAKEQLITQEVASVKTMTQTFDGKITKLETTVDQKMQEVSDKVLAFQQDDVYQKMLNGLSELKDMKQAMEIKDQLIEKQAQIIKEIHQKLGTLT